MELEEAEDEEWDAAITSTSQYQYTSNSGEKVKCAFKKILVAGFVAFSAPLVLPPLFVASAIGLVVSMPYAIFLASHTCTQNLMNKLLPRPQNPPLLQDFCFQPDIDDDVELKSKQEWSLNDEAKRDNETVNVNEENMIHDYEKVCDEEDDNEKLGDKIYGESDEEKSMSGGKIVDEIVNENEESETAAFEFGGVTDVVLEEYCCDEVKEGDIEEEESQRETKGLLEKIRDEFRNDMRGEYEEGTCSRTNESDQDINLVIENMEDRESLGTEREMRNEENLQVVDCEEEMLQSRNDDNDNKDIDSSFNEVESCAPVRGNLEVDSSNDLQKPMTEETCELLGERGFQYESIPAEEIRDLLIETQVFDILVAEEDSSEVANDKTVTHDNFQEEQEPTILQKGKLDDKISDFENQEMQMHEESNIMDSSSGADARKIAEESTIPLCGENPDAYSYTIDLHNESSNITVDAHTDSMEVLVSSVELDSKPSECSSGKNNVCPSEEVEFNEGDIWKEIHAIRKIIGYESTSQASCVDELKALYIFTGVEPPTFVKENPFDPAEFNEKLHFLMSIVGIKPNVP